jgi:hypothetical protein
VCGGDGVTMFDALHGRHKAGDAILYAPAGVRWGGLPAAAARQAQGPKAGVAMTPKAPRRPMRGPVRSANLVTLE